MFSCCLPNSDVGFVLAQRLHAAIQPDWLVCKYFFEPLYLKREACTNVELLCTFLHKRSTFFSNTEKLQNVWWGAGK